MKKLFVFLVVCVTVSCATKNIISDNAVRQHVFLLGDNDDSKFYLIDSVKVAYQNGAFINSPIIAIDGIIFKYNKNLDTIVLPLKRNEIANIVCLNKSSSPVIYGKNETNGAIIINTVSLN